MEWKTGDVVGWTKRFIRIQFRMKHINKLFSNWIGQLSVLLWTKCSSILRVVVCWRKSEWLLLKKIILSSLSNIVQIRRTINSWEKNIVILFSYSNSWNCIIITDIRLARRLTGKNSKSMTQINNLIMCIDQST